MSMLLLMPLKYWFEIIFPSEANLHKKAMNENLYRLSKHMLLEMNMGYFFLKKEPHISKYSVSLKFRSNTFWLSLNVIAIRVWCGLFKEACKLHLKSYLFIINSINVKAPNKQINKSF